MQIESLEVGRRPSYDTEFPSMLVGMVEMKGPNGSQRIKLSNESLSKIFKVISDDVISTAQQNAAATRRAISDATAEALVLENSKVSLPA